MAASNLRLGTISFLINVTRGEQISDETLKEAGIVVGNLFSDGLKRHALDKLLVVRAIECRRGCIEIDIEIGASIEIVVEGEDAAALMLLKEYKAVRENLKQLISDLNGTIIVFKKLGERVLWLFKHDVRILDDKSRPPPADDTQ